MTINEAVRQLEFDREMICFDPTTGEEIPLHMLKTGNMDNYLTYLADGMAIEALKEIQQYREIGTVEEIKDLLVTISEASEDVDESGISVGLIKDLIRLGKYREIGTVEDCREAMEKQKAKKCVIDSCPDHTHYKCPSCGKIHLSRYKHGCPSLGRIPRFCEYCGQAIDENLEGMEDE